MASGEPALGDELLEIRGSCRSRIELVMVVRSLPVRWPISSAVRVSSVAIRAKAMRGFDRIEIFALNILDERDFEQAVVGNFSD